ncbi:MAG TPA: hypothetical protein VK473_12970 [Terriglobales bacterium]|nr:hypothetical protein [Terriglobales bacterium]
MAKSKKVKYPIWIGDVELDDQEGICVGCLNELQTEAKKYFPNGTFSAYVDQFEDGELFIHWAFEPEEKPLVQ